MSNSFYGREITIQFFAPLLSAEVAPLVDEIEPHFYIVRTERMPSPPWASPLLEHAAIIVAFASAAVAKGFLEELGKDAWRGIRSLLYHLYKVAKAHARYPSFHAFALDTSVSGVPVTFRIKKDTLLEHEFAGALEAAGIAIAADMLGQEAEPWITGGKRYVLEWDCEINAWRSM